jgi:hypothetical protein
MLTDRTSIMCAAVIAPVEVQQESISMKQYQLKQHIGQRIINNVYF